MVKLNNNKMRAVLLLATLALASATPQMVSLCSWRGLEGSIGGERRSKAVARGWGMLRAEFFGPSNVSVAFFLLLLLSCSSSARAAAPPAGDSLSLSCSHLESMES